MSDNGWKPCPFCGGEAEHITFYPFDGYQGEAPEHRIKCSRCGALITADNYEVAIERWNCRVPQEMSAREYFKQVRRLQKWADQLQRQYHKANETLYKVTDGDIDSSIEEVEKWAREHPEERNEE